MPEVPPASASTAEKREAQQERSRRFGIEALEGKGEALSFPSGFPTRLENYADPVNLKFPLAPDNRARNARARFKQFASTYSQEKSRRIVHTRIVQRLLDIGANPGYNPDDPLDALLPESLRDRMPVRRQKVSNFVLVQKVSLAEGEELQIAIGRVIRAVHNFGEAQQKRLCLRGIYKGFVIVQDLADGKTYKLPVKREGDEVLFTRMDEVIPTFVPATQVRKSGAQEPSIIPVLVEEEEEIKEPGLWEELFGPQI